MQGTPLEKLLAACSSSKNTGLPQLFLTSFWQLYFNNFIFLAIIKSFNYADFYELKTNSDDWQRAAKPHFPKK